MHLHQAKAKAVLRNLFTVFFFFPAFGQTDVSNFYFSLPQPVDGQANASLSTLEGTYFASEDTNRRLEIRNDTVFARKVIWSQFTDADLKALPKLMARNGYLHGLVRNDSVPYVRSADTLYFGIPYETVLFHPSETMVCHRLDDERFVLNYREKADKWTCSLLHRDKEGMLYLSYLDHDEVGGILPVIGQITDDKGEHIPTRVVQATGDGFRQFVEQGGFTGHMVFYEPGRGD
jgi:hypothetical protein